MGQMKALEIGSNVTITYHIYTPCSQYMTTVLSGMRDLFPGFINLLSHLLLTVTPLVLLVGLFAFKLP